MFISVWELIATGSMIFFFLKSIFLYIAIVVFVGERQLIDPSVLNQAHTN